MAVSDWVPIASVAATAVVGLGVPIVSARFDREKIRDQADEGRRDELRDVIDGAGAEITATIYAFDACATEADKTVGPTVTVELAETLREGLPLDAYLAHIRELWTYENRLAVRVGSEDEIYKAYSEATHALQRAVYTLSEVKAGEHFDNERRRRLRDIRDTAVRTQGEFHDAAARRVGLTRRT
jgi:hypothetical protein